MEHSGGGWAEASLARSFRQVALMAVIAWQLVAAVVSIGYGLGFTLVQLMVALIAGGVLWAASRGLIGSAAVIAPVLMAACGAIGFVVSGDLDSPLTLTACWQLNFATCIALLTVLRTRVVVLMVACGIGAGLVIVWLLPSWDKQLAISTIVTQAAIAVALRAGTAVLVGRARRTDRDTAEAERLTRREQVARRVNAQVAEESRVLHDTAINTLGAIAAGPWRGQDEDQIRTQCERDVDLLRALRRDRGVGQPVRLVDLFDRQRLPVQREGLDDDALAAWDDQLDPAATVALVGCVREAVTNAYKHTQVDRVRVGADVVAGQLQVTVSDTGAGFDPTTTRLRGITSSIVERGQDAGIEAVIDARPGHGTTVTLTVGAREEAAPGTSTQDTVEFVIGRAAALWGIGVTAVSVLLAVTGGTNEHRALLPMIALMLLSCAVPVVVRHRRSAVVLLVVLTVIIFVLSSAATGFGTVGIFHWQALAPTSAAVTLLARSPRRSSILLGVAVWAGAVGVLAFCAPTATAAALNVIAGAVGIGFAAAWLGFQHVVEQVTSGAFTARQRAFDAQLRVDAEQAARRTYLRWVAAGLDSAIGLLSAIATAEVDPAEPDVVRACGEEETHLRQLVQIGPELVHLGAELMPVLRHAHESKVPFTLRVGGVDTADDETARAIADLLRTIINRTPPDAGTMVSASVLPVRQQLRLTVTGSSLPDLPADAVLGRAHTTRLGTIDIVELTCAGVSVHDIEED